MNPIAPWGDDKEWITQHCEWVIENVRKRQQEANEKEKNGS